MIEVRSVQVRLPSVGLPQGRSILQVVGWADAGGPPRRSEGRGGPPASAHPTSPSFQLQTALWFAWLDTPAIRGLNTANAETKGNMDNKLRMVLAELIGTFILVLVGAGTVCAAGLASPPLSVTALALAEGFTSRRRPHRHFPCFHRLPQSRHHHHAVGFQTPRQCPGRIG